MNEDNFNNESVATAVHLSAPIKCYEKGADCAITSM